MLGRGVGDSVVVVFLVLNTMGGNGVGRLLLGGCFDDVGEGLLLLGGDVPLVVVAVVAAVVVDVESMEDWISGGGLDSTSGK